MRVINLRSILYSIAYNRKKTYFLIGLAIFLSIILIFGGIKSGKASRAGEIVQYNEDTAKYNDELEKYDNSLKTSRDNLKITKKEYEDLKEYCENSIYMNLDGNSFYSAQTEFYPAYLTEIPGSVTDQLYFYINSDKFISDLSKKYTKTKEEYFREVIGYSIVNGGIQINVNHFKESEVVAISDAISECIITESEKLKTSQPEFRLDKVDTCVTNKTDYGLIDAQNVKLNNMKGFYQAYTDGQNSITNQEHDRENYIINNAISAVYPYGTKDIIKCIIKQLIIAVVLAIILVLVLEIFIQLLSGKINSVDYFKAQNIKILNTFINEKDNEEKLNVIINDLVYSVRSTGNNSLYVEKLNDEENINRLCERIETSLKKSDIDVKSGVCSNDSVENLSNMYSMKNTVIIAGIGMSKL